jgi:hypothetical protein
MKKKVFHEKLRYAKKILLYKRGVALLVTIGRGKHGTLLSNKIGHGWSDIRYTSVIYMCNS